MLESCDTLASPHSDTAVDGGDAKFGAAAPDGAVRAFRRKPAAHGKRKLGANPAIDGAGVNARAGAGGHFHGNSAVDRGKLQRAVDPAERRGDGTVHRLALRGAGG